MIASLTGSTLKVVRNEFKDDLPGALAKYNPVIQINMDLIKRRLGLGTGISEIHVSSPEGYLAMLANIIHGGLGSGDGANPSGGTTSSSEKREKTKTESKGAKLFENDDEY